VEKDFMNVRKNRQKGFTIIEVVLVLAIAALIFLMVFIALPALQRSQRDTQRKNDLGRVQTALQNYQSNNRNSLPDLSQAGGSSFITGYLTVGGDSFADPDGTAYLFKQASDPTAFKAGEIDYTTSAICNGESVTTGQGASKIAFQYKLEGGGTVCVNN
jgi:prepilin-type N-terminal cleavage/methylation domain-containing protein